MLYWELCVCKHTLEGQNVGKIKSEFEKISKKTYKNRDFKIDIRKELIESCRQSYKNT